MECGSHSCRGMVRTVIGLFTEPEKEMPLTMPRRGTQCVVCRVAIVTGRGGSRNKKGCLVKPTWVLFFVCFCLGDRQGLYP